MRRIKVEGEVGVYHCMSRIVGGNRWLDDRAKEVFRKQLKKIADFCGVEVLTYCLLNNHFHILIRVLPQENGVIGDGELIRRVKALYGARSREAVMAAVALRGGGKQAEGLRQQLLSRMGDVSMFMKELKGRFTLWYNKERGSFGTIWSERFKSVLVEDEASALKIVGAYIDLNAVRAGLCADPKDYRWSGYAEAVAGVKESRRGIERMLRTKVKGVEQGWREVQREYRKLLYERGESKRRESDVAFRAEVVEKVLAEGGDLTTAEVLRCRVRYLTQGGILGSKEFVEGWREANASRYALQRKMGARRIPGACLDGLTVFRNPRRITIS